MTPSRLSACSAGASACACAAGGGRLRARLCARAGGRLRRLRHGEFPRGPLLLKVLHVFSRALFACAVTRFLFAWEIAFVTSSFCAGAWLLWTCAI